MKAKKNAEKTKNAIEIDCLIQIEKPEERRIEWMK